jgi:hypothetical protein
MLRRAAPFVLLALAACHGNVSNPPQAPESCFSRVPAAAPPATALANIGPDLQLVSPCGGRAQGAVASVNAISGGVLSWTASIAGDPSFTLEQTSFMTCALSTSIAMVAFLPPVSAKPGDAFDAVVTIRAEGDAFPPGTVNVHAVVGAAMAAVDRAAIDFGDVEINMLQREPLMFRNESNSPIDIVAPPLDPDLPFQYADGLDVIQLDPGGIASSGVALRPYALGDYSTTAVWVVTTAPEGTLPAGCTSTLSTALHVRIVLPDGGLGAGAPADAGGVDASGVD